jgi:ABC-2 type transport system permease protein
MTSTLAEAPEASATGARVGAARRPSVARGYRFELVKMLSQWRIRVLILVCWVAPAIFVAAVSQQGSLPADTCSAAGCTPAAGQDRWSCSDSRLAGRCRC